jgi:hypothetical protein
MAVFLRLLRSNSILREVQQLAAGYELESQHVLVFAFHAESSEPGPRDGRQRASIVLPYMTAKAHTNGRSYSVVVTCTLDTGSLKAEDGSASPWSAYILIIHDMIIVHTLALLPTNHYALKSLIEYSLLFDHPICHIIGEFENNQGKLKKSFWNRFAGHTTGGFASKAVGKQTC